MEGEQQTELDFDLGEGKMGLERAPAVTLRVVQVLFLTTYLRCRTSNVNLACAGIDTYKHTHAESTQAAMYTSKHGAL